MDLEVIRKWSWGKISLPIWHTQTSTAIFCLHTTTRNQIRTLNLPPNRLSFEFLHLIGSFFTTTHSSCLTIYNTSCFIICTRAKFNRLFECKCFSWLRHLELFKYEACKPNLCWVSEKQWAMTAAQVLVLCDWTIYYRSFAKAKEGRESNICYLLFSKTVSFLMSARYLKRLSRKNSYFVLINNNKPAGYSFPDDSYFYGVQIFVTS